MTSQNGRHSLNALPPGTVLHDYVVESELGSGGFSMVYLARHRLNSDWLFAIKEYLPGELVVRANDGTGVRPVNTESEEAFEDGLRRFRDEAEQLRRFRNERYIVSCLNYFEANGTAYLVMDYDDGLPLSEFLRQREAAGQPFTEADLRAVVEPLLEGLEVVHRAGVLHRDIKPGNIFVRRQDDITGRPAQPVLIDFGAAKQNYLAQHSRSQAPYTPGYAAYEQVSSEGDIGPWTDIYAVGALMWRMVAGGCAGDERLLVSDSGAGVWSPTPRAAETRAYALLRGRTDPMVPATELGAGQFSPHLLVTIDACLALIPDNRLQSCVQLKRLIEGSEALEPRNSEKGPQSEPDLQSTGDPVEPSAEHRDVESNDQSIDGTGAWDRARQNLRTFTRRLKWYERQRSIVSHRGEARKITDIPAVKRQNATSSRLLTIRTLRIAGAILAAVSLGAAIFLRVPLVPEQEGYRWESDPAVPGGASMVRDVARESPRWENNPLGAAMRQHGLLLNLAVFATERVAFEEDPSFDDAQWVTLLEADNWLRILRRSDSGTGIVSESILDRFEENRQFDRDDLVRIVEAEGTVGHRLVIGVFSRARSASEYYYLDRKAGQFFRDGRTLPNFGLLGILATITATVVDPIIIFSAFALIGVALRGNLLGTRRGILWGIAIGAVVCGTIVALQQIILHFVQGWRTPDVSVVATAVSASLGSVVFGALGALVSRRQHKEVAEKQDDALRVSAICGLSAPVLQFILEKLGLARQLDPFATLSLVFATIVIVALSYVFFEFVRFFARRRNWHIWMIALGELHAHSFLAEEGFSSFSEYAATVIIFPIFWMPSAIGLELLFRLFDKSNVPTTLGRAVRAVLLGLVAFFTWMVFFGLFAGIGGTQGF